MIRPTAYCDECGRAKAEGNHWFRAWSLKSTFWIYQWDAVNLPDDDAVSAATTELHLCSESCAVKAMSKAIGQQGTD